MKTYYNQVFSDLDRGVKLQSRTHILTQYMQKYFPNLMLNYRESVDGFIRGDISYEEMLTLIQEAKSARRIQNMKKRQVFDTIELETYGPRSLAPIPYTFADESDIVLFEYDRFRDAFGSGSKTRDKVPGTYEQQSAISQRFSYLMRYRRDTRGAGKFGIF